MKLRTEIWLSNTMIDFDYDLLTKKLKRQQDF